MSYEGNCAAACTLNSDSVSHLKIQAHLSSAAGGSAACQWLSPPSGDLPSLNLNLSPSQRLNSEAQARAYRRQ